jgi:hypothetical protein
MIANGSLVTSATALRVGLTWFELWAKRTPPLARLALAASLGGDQTRKAEATFRDDLIALARETAELSSRELRRAIDDLDKATRRSEEPGSRPLRPYRYKL